MPGRGLPVPGIEAMKAEIDGRSFESPGPVTILEAARKLGLFVPTLCAHPRLPPASACRICLVEIAGRREPVPACATLLEEGMRVTTESTSLRGLRRSVLELILSEQSPACRVCAERKTGGEPKAGIRKTVEPGGGVPCPKDGRCRLQEIVEAVGGKAEAFPESPRAAEPRRDDPLIDRDPGLCILCGLCVRACRDLRGASVLTFIGRGRPTFVGTAMDRPLLESGCRFCGACVDVCPTGALLERAVRHRRPDTWPAFVCALCAEGCLLEAGLEAGRLVGTRPADGRANRGQTCLKGRFLLPDVLSHPDRLTTPLVRRGGRLEPASWEEALAAAAAGLAGLSGSIETVASAQDGCEDLWALRALAAALGSGRIRLAGPSSPLDVVLAAAGRQPAIGLPGRANGRLAEFKSFLVLDLNPDLESPILGLEIHQALRAGARLAVLTAGESCLERCAKVRVRAERSAAADFLLEVLAKLSPDGASDRKHPRKPQPIGDEKAARIAALLQRRRPAAIVFGPRIASGPEGRRNAAVIWSLAAAAEAALVPVPWEANARAARALLGPSRIPDADGSVRGWILADGGPPPARREGSFVLALSAFRGRAAAEADVVLPRTLFAEGDGTWVNREGRIQRSRAVAPAPGQARSLRSIVAVLAAAAGLPEVVPGSDEAILGEIERTLPAFSGAGRAWASEPEVFLGGEARAPRRAVSIPSAGEGGEGGETVFDPDDILGWPAASALKALKAVRRR